MITTLLALHASGRMERLELDPARRFVIGRALDADYLLDRHGVDRRHVELAVHDGGWWIMGGVTTTTGTWLSDRFVTESRRLVDGDVIQIGEVTDVLFRFSAPGVSLPTAPPRHDRVLKVTPEEAQARGLPPVGVTMSRPDGMMLVAGTDASSWLHVSSPPGGGPHGRIVRGPTLAGDPASHRRLQEHLSARERPDTIAHGRVLALGAELPAIAWVSGEALGRYASLAVAAPLPEAPGEAMVLVFCARAPLGPLEPWAHLTHPQIAPFLAATPVR